jgi:ESCRT-II complex subunit VPS25
VRACVCDGDGDARLTPSLSGRAHKVFDLNVADAAAKLPIFNNAKINRKLSAEQVRFFLDYLATQGNVEWKDKAKTACFVFFKTPAQWGALIYQWALDQGKANTVCTVFEIQQGEDAEGQEFFNIDSETLMKALKQLEKEGKAQIFAGSSADNLGVKFFSL